MTKEAWPFELEVKGREYVLGQIKRVFLFKATIPAEWREDAPFEFIELERGTIHNAFGWGHHISTSKYKEDQADERENASLIQRPTDLPSNGACSLYYNYHTGGTFLQPKGWRHLGSPLSTRKGDLFLYEKTEPRLFCITKKSLVLGRR